jgi:hypothetical protein
MTGKTSTAYSISHLVSYNFKYHRILFLRQNQFQVAVLSALKCVYIVFPLLQRYHRSLVDI